jgi:hypothetical protein
VPLIVAFGAPPWVLACYELLDVAVTLWSHSNLRIPETARPRAAPRHRHARLTPHSPPAWKTETNSNFGAVFPIWDLLFGTFRSTPREPHERMRLGLDGRRGRDAHRPLWLLASVAVASSATRRAVKTAPFERTLASSRSDSLRALRRLAGLENGPRTNTDRPPASWTHGST